MTTSLDTKKVWRKSKPTSQTKSRKPAVIRDSIALDQETIDLLKNKKGSGTPRTHY